MNPVCLRSLLVADTTLTSCSFCHGNPNLVSCGTDGRIHLHKIGKKYRRIDFKGGPTIRTCVAVPPATQEILSGDSAGKLVHNNLKNKRCRVTFTPHSDRVNSIHFTHDGSRFTTASNDKTAKIWDYAGSEFVASLNGHEGWVTSSAFSADGYSVVTSSRDKFVRLWDVRTSERVQSYGPTGLSVTRAAFHPNGQVIGFGTDYGSFELADTRNQQILQHYERVHYGPITSLQFHPTGLFGLTTSTDKKIRIWDLVEGQLLHSIRKHESPILDGRWNRKGSEFVTCDKGGNLLHWEAHFEPFETPSSLGEVHVKAIADPINPSETPEEERASRAQRSREFIDSRFTRMLGQLDMIGKTIAMMNQRMGMIDRKVVDLQNDEFVK